MILFLDFDGVTHARKGSLPFDPKCIDALSVAVKHLDASIVIASTWREEFSLADMREFLGKEMAPRIIDVTPVLHLDPSVQWPRFVEVAAWLESNKSFYETWAAVDDEKDNYPSGYNYLTNHLTGFVEADIAPFLDYASSKRGPLLIENIKQLNIADETTITLNNEDFNTFEKVINKPKVNKALNKLIATMAPWEEPGLTTSLTNISGQFRPTTTRMNEITEQGKDLLVQASDENIGDFKE